MTSMYEAQKGVIAEVKTRILQLTPEYEEQIRFMVRDEVDRAISDMEEELGTPRLFEISEARYDQPTYIGCSTRGYKYTHEISIHYPYDEVWSFGMNSDAELIRNDLLTNATSVSGIQQRHLDPTAEMGVEIDPDDAWMTSILSLVVYYEIS